MKVIFDTPRVRNEHGALCTMNNAVTDDTDYGYCLMDAPEFVPSGAMSTPFTSVHYAWVGVAHRCGPCSG